MQRVRDLANKARDFWLNHLVVDLGLAGIILSLHIVLVLVDPVWDVLGNAIPADRRSAYTSTAIVVSLLASFSSVAIGQASSAKGARADALRRQAAEALARNWRSVFQAGMYAAVLAIVCLLLDPSRRVDGWVPVVVRWVFEFTVLLATVKFVRLSSLFYEVITLSSKSAVEPEEEPKAPALRPVPGWNNKAG